MSKLIMSSMGINIFSRFSKLTRLSLQQANCHNTSILANTIKLGAANNKIKTNGTLNCTYKRSLFTEQTLGIDKLTSLQESRGRFYENGKDRYIARISNFVAQGDYDSVLKEDLINLIGLAETEEHLDLIENIVSNSRDQSEEARGTWGSAVMRLYYKMNQLERAFNNIRDNRFGNFFNQRITYQIAQTMLYNAGRYKDVVDIYDLSVERLKIEADPDPNPNLERAPFKRYTTDRRLVVLMAASCAKLNSLEYFEKAQQVFLMDKYNPNLKGKTLSFVAYMGINLDKAREALNILAEAPSKTYVVFRELKTIALLKLDRLDDVLYHLRESISLTKREHKLMIQQAYDLLSEKLATMDANDEIVKQLNDLLVELKDNQQIGSETIESILFREIDMVPQGPRMESGGGGRPPRFTDFNQDSEQRYGEQRYGEQRFGESRSNQRFEQRSGRRERVFRKFE